MQHDKKISVSVQTDDNKNFEASRGKGIDAYGRCKVTFTDSKSGKTGSFLYTSCDLLDGRDLLQIAMHRFSCGLYD